MAVSQTLPVGQNKVLNLLFSWNCTWKGVRTQSQLPSAWFMLWSAGSNSKIRNAPRSGVPGCSSHPQVRRLCTQYLQCISYSFGPTALGHNFGIIAAGPMEPGGLAEKMCPVQPRSCCFIPVHKITLGHVKIHTKRDNPIFGNTIVMMMTWWCSSSRWIIKREHTGICFPTIKQLS